MKKKYVIGLLLGGFLSHPLMADIYSPQTTYLQRALPENLSVDPAVTERAYLKKVVLDAGYVANEASISTFTFNQWKQKNGFLASVNSSTKASAKYFNSADLGLGRDMNCVDQVGNPDVQPARPNGVACYVSNHGKIGGNSVDGLAALNNTSDIEFATVAMEYRPDAVENKVRFFVFNSSSTANLGDGTIIQNIGAGANFSKIKLDSGSGHSQPGVCLACHGGSINSAGVVTNAHFLPFDTFSLEFESQTKRTLAQAEFDKMNRWVYRAEKAAYGNSSVSAQKQILNFLAGSYTPAPGTGQISASAVMNDNFIDRNFSPLTNGVANADLDKAYSAVVKPFCRGCHMASNLELSSSSLNYACLPSAGMPHAEVTDRNLLRHHEFVQPILKKVLPGSGCDHVFNLIDFSEGGGISYKYLRGGYEYSPAFKVDVSKATPASNSTNRTLQGTGTYDVLHSRNVARSPYGEKLVSLSFAYSLPDSVNDHLYVAPYGTPLSGDGLVTKTTNDPIIAGTVFKKHVATFDLSGATGTYDVELSLSSGNGNPLKPIEVDDILTEWTVDPNVNVLRADFDDKTFGDFEGKVSDSITGVNSTCQTKRTSLNDVLAFSINQSAKVKGNPGRYSLTTNKILCAGETVWKFFSLNGPANKVSKVTFDVTKFGGGTPRIFYSSGPNGAAGGVVDVIPSVNGATVANGYVEFDIAANAYFGILYVPGSGTATAPDAGYSIDNLAVYTPK